MFRRIFYSIISVLVFGAQHLFTALIVIINLIFAGLNRKNAVIAISHFWAKTILLLLGKRLEIQGLENIRKNRKYILVANHASIYDINAIMSFFPGVAWFGREYLVRIPLFGKLLLMTHYIPVKEASITNTKTLMDQLIDKSGGNTIAIFPEGTRTVTGRISRFHRGFIYLLRVADVDILPVTLNGFFRLKPKTRFYIDFSSKIGLVIHKPVSKTDLVDKKDDEILTVIRDIIESAYEF
jgi:1-acyl-sn-glycerol-3-phosphate acyltransferase